MEEIKIRIANVKDWKEISELFEDLLKQHKDFGNFHKFNTDFKNKMGIFVKKEFKKRKTKFFVAEVNKKIVGFVVVYLLKKPGMYEHKYHGWVEGIVDKNHQRRGIGEKLTSEVIGWLKKRGIKRVELEVNLKNKKGINAWRKYGFKDYELILYKEI